MRRIESTLLRPRISQTTSAKLVLQTGSRAGLEAPLQFGYYMIGRHKECQIRPKSRSVSRHHCLIFFQGDLFQVLDLGSTAGTFLNDERIEEKKWYPIGDGDHVRCGKIEFQICQTTENQSSGFPNDEDEESASMVNGAAWQEADVASYLDAEDEAERQERYGAIRQRQQPASESVEQESDVDIFDDDFNVEYDTTVTTTPEPEREKATEEKPQSPAKRERKTGKTPKSSTKTKTPRLSARDKKKSPKVARVGGGFGSGLLKDTERLKLVGVVALTILTLSVLAYSVYRNAAGTANIRVLDETE